MLCDGIDDCRNGSDEIPCTYECIPVSDALNSTMRWIRVKRNEKFLFVHDNILDKRPEYLVSVAEEQLPTRIGFATKDECNNAFDNNNYIACQEKRLNQKGAVLINCGPFRKTNLTFQSGSNRHHDHTHSHMSSLFHKSFREDAHYKRHTIMMKFDFAELYTFFHYDQAVTQDEFSFDGVVKLIATVFFVSFASGLCYLNLRSWHNLHNIRHAD